MKLNLLILGFLTATSLSSLTYSEEFEVQMLNTGADGVMVFEPSVLPVSYTHLTLPTKA